MAVAQWRWLILWAMQLSGTAALGAIVALAPRAVVR